MFINDFNSQDNKNLGSVDDSFIQHLLSFSWSLKCRIFFSFGILRSFLEGSWWLWKIIFIFIFRSQCKVSNARSSWFELCHAFMRPVQSWCSFLVMMTALMIVALMGKVVTMTKWPLKYHVNLGERGLRYELNSWWWWSLSVYWNEELLQFMWLNPKWL